MKRIGEVAHSKEAVRSLDADGAATDVTVKVQALEALRESEALRCGALN